MSFPWKSYPFSPSGPAGTSGLPATDHNLIVHETFVYEANYRSGLRVFDISEISNADDITEIVLRYIA